MWKDKTPYQGLFYLGREHVELEFTNNDATGSYECIVQVFDVNTR